MHLLRPCHVTFRQQLTKGLCEAVWAISFERGRFGDVDLTGFGAVVFPRSDHVRRRLDVGTVHRRQATEEQFESFP